MSGPAVMTLPPAPRPARNPVLAVALSLALPGVGLLYTGAIAPGLLFIAAWVVAKPLLALLLAAGALELRQWYFCDFACDFVLRAVAAVVSFVFVQRTASQPLRVVPPGVYGLSLLMAVGAKLLLSQQLQKLVPIAELSADSYGLRAGEYVQARRADPAPGVLGVYLYDSRDAGPQNPAAPTMREAYLGRVAITEEKTFTVEGLDASLPNADFLGKALGVIFSKDDAGAPDWSRLGALPESTPSLIR